MRQLINSWPSMQTSLILIVAEKMSIMTGRLSQSE